MANRIDIKSCSRCGQDHNNLLMHEFKRPVVIASNEIFTHYTVCPTLVEPIIIKVVDDFEDKAFESAFGKQ